MTLYTHNNWTLGNGTPGCHALIIGAGRYGQSDQGTGGMRALPGVARSALDFANFLISNSDNLFQKLQTIQLLASADDGSTITWQGQTVKAPSMSNIKQAIKDFRTRVEYEDGSLAILYFSGHGLFLDQLCFLTDDFDPSGAVDDYIVRLEGLQTAMQTLNAPAQLFVYDCCQDLPSQFANMFYGIGGTSLINANGKALNKHVEQVRIDAAQPGHGALTGPESWLTSALIEAFKNDAARLVNNEWWVTPGQLAAVINPIGQARFGPRWPLAKVSAAQINFHRILKLDKTPSATVNLSIPPSEAVLGVNIALKDVNTKQVVINTSSDSCDWQNCTDETISANVEAGHYFISAESCAAGQPSTAKPALIYASPREIDHEVAL